MCFPLSKRDSGVYSNATALPRGGHVLRESHGKMYLGSGSLSNRHTAPTISSFPTPPPPTPGSAEPLNTNLPRGKPSMTTKNKKAYYHWRARSCRPSPAFKTEARRMRLRCNRTRGSTCIAFVVHKICAPDFSRVAVPATPPSTVCPKKLTSLTG